LSIGESPTYAKFLNHEFNIQKQWFELDSFVKWLANDSSVFFVVKVHQLICAFDPF